MRDKIIECHQAIVSEFGPWTAHDIDLGYGISTMNKNLQQKWRVDYFDSLMRRHSRLAETSLLSKYFPSLIRSKLDYRKLRILDLACLEGLFTIEYARLGAETVGIEIRDVHLAKARFAKEILGLKTCDFIQGDVREIPAEIGIFNVIICAGILYHLDFPDCVKFLQDLTKRSSDLIIIDSHYAYDHITESVLPLSEMQEYEFQGKAYRGRAIMEHSQDVSDDEKARTHVWASIDNNVSVWLDERDVVALMADAGFLLVERGWVHEKQRQYAPDRPTLVFKKQPHRQF